MDKYQDLNMIQYVTRSDIPAGTNVMRTVWAFKINFDKDGKFEKFNPRWCIVGTGMDREVYDAYSEVMHWNTLLMLIAIRASYAGIVDFHFDVGSAFQATRTDDPDDAELPSLYCEQAKGFERYDSQGNAFVVKVLTAHQGRIDSARLFSKKFGKTLKTRLGCYKLSGIRNFGFSIMAPLLYLLLTYPRYSRCLLRCL